MNKRGLESAIRMLTQRTTALIAAHRAAALPGNKNIGKRNGNGAPLSAWMYGAGAKYPSRITAVIEGRVSYPYNSFAASRDILRDRIAKRYGITSAQFHHLDLLLERRYRGRSSGPHYRLPDGLIDKQLGSAAAYEAAEWLRECAGNGCLPLRSILSRQVADSVIQFQLYQTVKEKL